MTSFIRQNEDLRNDACGLERLADEKGGPFLYVIGAKIATLESICNVCPMVDICAPEFWRMKNMVRVRVGKEVKD